jgi:hypothetical protein
VTDSGEIVQRSWPLARGGEVGINVESRRAGEVSIGVSCGEHGIPGFGWMTTDDARALAMALLSAARESEDLAASKARAS